MSISDQVQVCRRRRALLLGHQHCQILRGEFGTVIIFKLTLNISNYPQVYCDVEPKRMALEEANMELADAQETLENVKAKVHCSGVE